MRKLVSSNASYRSFVFGILHSDTNFSISCVVCRSGDSPWQRDHDDQRVEVGMPGYFPGEVGNMVGWRPSGGFPLGCFRNGSKFLVHTPPELEMIATRMTLGPIYSLPPSLRYHFSCLKLHFSMAALERRLVLC